MVALYLSGLSSDDVGIRCGCSAAYVLEVVRAAGHEVRGRGGVRGRPNRGRRPFRLTAEQMVLLYQAGATGQQVADQAGCSLDTVYRALRRADVPRRDWRDYRWTENAPRPKTS